MTEADPAARPPMASADALLPLSWDDFQAAGVPALLAANPHANMHELRARLAAALAASDGAAARALTLLEGVCSMQLVPEEPTLIYRPKWEWGDGTGSLRPDHLTAGIIDVLVQLADTIEHPPALRARLADLIFLRDRKRGHQYARLAISSYRAQGDITFEAWCLGEGAGWHRALQLAILVKATDEAEQIEQTLLAAFFGALDADGVDPLHYLRPLELEKRGRGRAAEIAQALETVGRRHLVATQPFPAQSYFDAAAWWYSFAGNQDKRADMLALAAEAIVMQADQGDGPMVEHTWLTKAIEAYRQIPGPSRQRLQVDEAIEALLRRKDTAGRAVLGEMHTIRGPSIDVTEEVQAAIKHVSGRNPLMALMAFCGLDTPPDAEKMLADAEQSLRDFPLSAIFGSVTMAGDGRQVANDGPHLGWEEQVAAKAREHFRLNAGFVVRSAIAPALDQLRYEHAYRIDDFIAIAERSPVVPTDRARMVGKGLHAGFYGDMVQAMHILMPQFEHMVRQVLQGAGAFTAHHERDGRDSEVALARLLERPQMVEEFGAGLTLAIHALMCDRAGSNLRNDVAHGLADEALCGSILAVYAWWLILQLVVETFASTLDGMAETVGQ